MATVGTNQHRPREWRRRVAIDARVRTGAQWVEGRILNISSRGMLLHCSRPLDIGVKLEIRQDRYVVTAMVIWRDGNRTGLECCDGVALADWLAASAEQASSLGYGHRHRQPRPIARPATEACAGHFARKLQFCAVAAIALTLASSAAVLAVSALSAVRPAVQALSL